MTEIFQFSNVIFFFGASYKIPYGNCKGKFDSMLQMFAISQKRE